MRTTETPEQHKPLRTVQRMLLQPPTSNAEHLAESCLGRLEDAYDDFGELTSFTPAPLPQRCPDWLPPPSQVLFNLGLDEITSQKFLLDLNVRQPPLNPLCGVFWGLVCVALCLFGLPPF